MKEEKNIYNGITKIEEEIYPAYINLKNSKYIEIDNLYYAGLICVDYYREQTDLILKTLIETNINMNISIFYEKQDSYKTIKDLTYHIGNVGVELKESNENRQDIDIAAFTYNDAKYIRKEMQLNNEDLYFLYVYRSALQGLGDTVLPMVSGGAEFVMRVSAALLLPKLVGENGIFYAEIMAWSGAAVLLAAGYYIRIRKLKKYLPV